MSWDVMGCHSGRCTWRSLEHFGALHRIIEWPLSIPRESTCWSMKTSCLLRLHGCFTKIICERINTCEKPMVPQWCWFRCFWWWSLRINMIKTLMVLLMMVMDSQEVLKLFRLALQTIQALKIHRSEMVSSWLPLTSATMRIESGRKRLMCWPSEAGGLDPCKVIWSFYDWFYCNNWNFDARPFQARNDFGLFQRALVAADLPRQRHPKKQCWWPSWEQTYPLPRHSWRWFSDFPFPKVNMLSSQEGISS